MLPEIVNFRGGSLFEGVFIWSFTVNVSKKSNIHLKYMFFFISMGNFQFYLRPYLFFLKSNVVPCLVHAYFFLKSNIAMLIFGVGKTNRFYFFQRRKHIFRVLKLKVVQKIKKSRILVRFFSFIRWIVPIFRGEMTLPCLFFGISTLALLFFSILS